jgi:hypothetical protein
MSHFANISLSDINNSSLPKREDESDKEEPIPPNVEFLSIRVLRESATDPKKKKVMREELLSAPISTTVTKQQIYKCRQILDVTILPKMTKFPSESLPMFISFPIISVET